MQRFLHYTTFRASIFCFPPLWVKLGKIESGGQLPHPAFFFFQLAACGGELEKGISGDTPDPGRGPSPLHPLKSAPTRGKEEPANLIYVCEVRWCQVSKESASALRDGHVVVIASIIIPGAALVEEGYVEPVGCLR